MPSWCQLEEVIAGVKESSQCLASRTQKDPAVGLPRKGQPEKVIAGVKESSH